MKLTPLTIDRSRALSVPRLTLFCAQDFCKINKSRTFIYDCTSYTSSYFVISAIGGSLILEIISFKSMTPEFFMVDGRKCKCRCHTVPWFI